MAEVTTQRTGAHLRKLFAILMEHPEGLIARQALDKLVDRVQLTPYEAGTYQSGGLRFEKIIRFATVDCAKAGWLLKQKGRWTITSQGIDAFNTLTDPAEFYSRARFLYHKWKKTQGDQPPSEDIEEAEAEKGAAVTLEEAQGAAWGEITQFIHAMNPYDFQDLVGALLKALGYHIAWTAPPGKDGGVDLIATPDPLGTGSPRIKVQVKRQVAAVDVNGLRSFMATLGTEDVGLYVCLGGFTKDADFEARQQTTRRITLIDIDRLYDLWVENYPELPDVDQRRLPLQPVYFLAPE